MTQRSGRWALVERAPEGTMSGVADILWSRVFVTDVAMLEVFGDSLANLPDRDGLRFYLRLQSEAEQPPTRCT